MAIKYFDIKRLVNFGNGNYVCFDDIVGVYVGAEYVYQVYTTGGEFVTSMPLADFEAEVERAIKQTMSDQNENLNDFQNSLKEKIAELKYDTLLNKTDKVSDAN